MTTLIVTPHPDDEVLRLSPYIQFARDRGEQLVLVAVTDGGSTKMGPAEGLTKAQVEVRRRAEQIGTWSALTRGKGIIRNLGITDGTITPATARSGVQSVLQSFPDADEVYVAAHRSDQTSDHLAVAEGMKGIAPVVRWAFDPRFTTTSPGVSYRPRNNTDRSEIEDALSAYWWTLGPRSSVPFLVQALRDNDYLCRVDKG